MLNLNDVLKTIIVKDIPHDGVFADFSLQNIYDLLYIAQYASEGQVYAFTSDDAVIEETSKILEENFQDNVALINDSPLNAGEYVNNFIDSAIFRVSGISPDALGTVEKVVSLLKNEGRMLLECDALNTDACEVYLRSLGKGFDIYRVNSLANADIKTFFIVQKLSAIK